MFKKTVVDSYLSSEGNCKFIEQYGDGITVSSDSNTTLVLSENYSWDGSSCQRFVITF